MAQSGRAAPVSTKELEASFLGKIDVTGAIVFGGIDDKFFYIPREGFVDGDSLDVKAPFAIEEARLTKMHRLASISFNYEPAGDNFQFSVFCRVTRGEWYISSVVSILQALGLDFHFAQDVMRNS